jgi:hypothetical protein
LLSNNANDDVRSQFQLAALLSPPHALGGGEGQQDRQVEAPDIDNVAIHDAAISFSLRSPAP